MRITTNMTMRNYQNNLLNSMNTLETNRRQVESGRRFAHSYEDPTAAAKAGILERKYARNEDYLNNVQNTQKWQDTQEDAINQLNDMAKEIVGNYAPTGITDTTGDAGRKTMAETLRGLQQSMVYALNSKYGESFVLAGADGGNPPFVLSEDGKTLTYRGLDVSDPENQAALEELSKETSYVDLGFGLTFDANNQIVSSSAFNVSVPGINAVGFGTSDDGYSKNLVLLAGEMASELENPEFNKEKYGKMWDEFGEGAAQLRNLYTSTGTKTQQLNKTKEQLDSQQLAMSEQYDAAVGINSATAITNYSWAMYSYNTALKVGTSILSPSLLDFMK